MYRVVRGDYCIVKLMIPSMLDILTRDNPMGQGLWGDLVEKTPLLSPPNLGGVTLAGTFVLSVAWKWNIILEKTNIENVRMFISG